MSEPSALHTQADRLAEAKQRQAQREAGIRAQAFGEGRKAERNDILKAAGARTLEDLSMLEKVKDAAKQEHAGHLRTNAKANYHQGLTHGLVAAVLMLAAGLFAGVTIQTSGFSMRVADERIPRPQDGVPDIQYEPARNENYERNPREPGN